MYFFQKHLSYKSNHAGSKAVLDAESILINNGWNPLRQLKGDKTLRIFSLFLSILCLRNSTLFFQYPSDFKKIKFNKIFKLNSVKTICLIHDLEGLRYNSKNIKEEINNLNKFDYLIAHNSIMKEWLVANGCMANIIILELFDYLLENKFLLENTRETDIAFAGNLEKNKSGFIYNLDEINNLTINLYGPSYVGTSNGNIKYQGQFSPEELVSKIEGKFGLIWDGASLNSCEGITGNYTRYNNPHKLSFYIASELPVICWSEMAIAKFVKEENIGICIDNLHELQSKLASISTDQYNIYLENVRKVRRKVIDGGYLVSALNRIME